MLVLIKWLYSLLDKRDLRKMRVLALMLTVAALLETISVGAVVPFIQLITSPNRVLNTQIGQKISTLLGASEPRVLLIWCSLAWLALAIFKNAFSFWSLALQERFLGKKSADISYRLFNIYIKSSWSDHINNDSSKMISTAEDYTQWPLNSSFLALFILISEGMVILFVVSLFIFAEPVVTLTVSALLGTCFTLAYIVLKKWIERLSPRRVSVYEARMKVLQEGLGALKEIKVLNCENTFLQKYRSLCNQTAELSSLFNVLQIAPRLAVEALVVCAIVLVVVMVLMQGRDIADITVVLGLFTLGAFRLMPSMNRIVSSLNNLRFYHDTIKSIHHDLYEIKVEPSPRIVADLPLLSRELRVEALGYRYPNAVKQALHDISFTLERGKAIGLVGRSGSGKTTLADVILGLLTPEEGRVLVDGVNILDNMSAWQKQVGYVPQSVALLDASLRENIALGVPPNEIDETRLHEALQLASLSTVVSQLPQGLDTLLGDRGLRLSGGQRQRIGIARALYRCPTVLVLDEATSALDVQTEVEVSLAIEKLRGNCTLIIVAHRLSTIRNCDQLLLINDGCLAQMGTFTSLNESSEEFRNMVKLAELVGATS